MYTTTTTTTTMYTTDFKQRSAVGKTQTKNN